MTHHKHIKAGLVVALAGGAFMASGCGESAPEAAKATARPDKVDFTRFLMRDGEQPGFRRVESVLTESAETFAEHARLTKAEQSRMRSAGMGPATFQPTEGPSARGVTSVTLFASAQGRQALAGAGAARGLHPQAHARRVGSSAASPSPASRARAAGRRPRAPTSSATSSGSRGAA